MTWRKLAGKLNTVNNFHGENNLIKLRKDYQLPVKNAIMEAWQSARAVLAVMATGAGKTVVFASIIHDHKGASAAVVHRKEIVVQISCSLALLGVKHRIVAPPATVRLARRKHLEKFGKSFVDPAALCGVASVQTLTSKSAAKNTQLQSWLRQVTLAVLDECFPAGTLVDGRPIETIEKGDYVTAYDEKSGALCRRKVTHVFKQKAPDLMVRVCLSGRQYVNCTGGHPFYTDRGWVKAAELTENDKVLYVRERSGLDGLPEVEVREDREGVLQQSLQPGLPVEEVVRGHGENKPKIRFGQNEEKQPNAQGGVPQEGLSNTEIQTARAPCSRREWAAIASGRVDTAANVQPSGLHGSDDSADGRGPTFRRVAHSLQDRLRKLRPKNSDRGRRGESQFARAQSTGQEERRVSEWRRVDGVTVYEREDCSRLSGRVCDGYVYNLEVEGVHTYIADGAVAHNCHHYTAGGLWGRALKVFSNARMLGVTACSERADGKGLGVDADGFAEELVEGPQVKWLIREGYLSPFKYFAPTTDLDLEGVAVTASGDFNSKALRARVVESHIVGDVVKQYLQFAKGKRAIVFATDVATANEMADSFNANGVRAIALDGTTDDSTRDKASADFEHGSLDVLVNVDLFDEGYDVPAAECAILARPTQSLNKFLQMCGRVLRVVYGKGYDLETQEGRLAAIANGGKPNAVIIDPVRNWERHGMPDWPRQWTLAGKEKGTRSNSDTIPQRVCDSCTQPYEAFYKACPYCGAEPEPAGRSLPEQVDGDLLELDVEAMAALFEKMRKADCSDEEFQRGLFARNVPAVGHSKQLKAHRDAKYRREVLRQLVGWWVGAQEGRDLSEVHRRFFHRFGVDIATAFTLDAKQTDALADKIAACFSLDAVLT